MQNLSTQHIKETHAPVNKSQQMVRIQTRASTNTKEVGFKVTDLIFMKSKALVVECLFTEMCLLSLGEGLISYQATVFTYTCSLPDITRIQYT